MATDYDAPRRTESDTSGDDSLEAIKARRKDAQSSAADVDDGETVEAVDLPGADLSSEELTVSVVPKQRDEFTCSVCFLVQHRSRLATEKNGQAVCIDCV